MIELKNIIKVYKSKKSSSTKALDNINLKLSDRGMTFILGKSGSGKSTLLNIIGGLDNITEGDMLVDGTNIKKFKKNKYDAYRNTYIGFIFQDFNILEEYNVYENIELALKLQNKKTNTKEINELLNKLGIGHLEKRKINELSGGQKQRVAIARALIKKPKVILADEPTGNLDRASSEQIFNILKEISKDRLVVVVSHDIESAQKYADRIVQIEDGKIINDTNTNEIIGNNKLELKKSRLPFLYALKMSLTGLKQKPLKLLMTIILTTMSLIFMGLTVNSSMFDPKLLIVDTMKQNNDYTYKIKKVEYSGYGSEQSLILENKDYESIKNITNTKLNKSYILFDNNKPLGFELGPIDDELDFYSGLNLYYEYVEIEDERVVGDIIGKMPQESNEIIIHKYLADNIIKRGIKDNKNEFYYPKDYNQIINDRNPIKLGDNSVIIVGITNNEEDSLFDEERATGKFTNEKLKDYANLEYFNKANYIYVKGFTQEVKLKKDKEILEDYTRLFKKVGYNVVSLDNTKAIKNNIEIITKDGYNIISKLDKNDVILSLESLKAVDSNFNKGLNDYLKENSSGVYEELIKEYIINYLRENNKILGLQLSINTLGYNLENNDLNIVGVSLDDINYISYKYVEEYEPITKSIYSIQVFDNDTNNLKNTFDNLTSSSEITEDTNGIKYVYEINHNMKVSEIINNYKYLKIYLLVISIIFVLFNMLLFSNFITTSISYCKKEIGILRALGTSRKDTIKIFGYESLIIAFLSWLFSIASWYFICDVLNNSLFGNLYYEINGILPHPLIPLIMFIYTILIALAITILSISRITNIKPIDAILNK